METEVTKLTNINIKIEALARAMSVLDLAVRNLRDAYGSYADIPIVIFDSLRGSYHHLSGEMERLTGERMVAWKS